MRATSAMVSSCKNRRSSQRVFSVVLGIVLVLTCLLTTACSTTTISDGESQHPVSQIVPSKLAIVHTGGAKGAFSRGEDAVGLACVTGLAQQLEEQGYDVLLLDSGNSLGTGLPSELTDGEETVGYLNAAGYDALAPGEAELSLGLESLTRRISQSDFSYLSANIARTDDGEPLEAAHQTFTLSDGRTVGVFGLTAPQAVDTLQPLASEGFEVIDGPASAREDETARPSSFENLVEVAQQQVAELRSQDCRLVICLAGLGVDDQGSPIAQRLAASVSGIDVLLDASEGSSTHQSVPDASGEETFVIQTADALRSVSVVTWERGTLTADAWDTSREMPANEQVDALVTQSEASFEHKLEEQICTSKAPLEASVAQSGESGLGKLAASAMLWEAERSSSQKPDAAILVAATLQASLPKGPITFADVLAALPHAQTRLCMLEVTGAQLQEALAPLLAQNPTPSEYMPQIAGITLQANTDDKDASKQTSQDKTDTQSNKQEKAKPTIVSVGGKAFSPKETYTIVTCEELAGPDSALFGSMWEPQESKDGEVQKEPSPPKLTDLNTSAGKALASYLQHECKNGIPKRFFDD